MISCKQSCRLLVRNLTLSKGDTISGHRRLCFSSKIKFLTKILGELVPIQSAKASEFTLKNCFHLEFSNPTATKTFLEKNDCLKKMDQADVADSVNYLTMIGISIEDMKRQPKILCYKRTTLRNRHEILSECGCSMVNVFVLNRYMSICGENETTLKKVGLIENKTNLQQHLADCLNVEFHPCKEDDPLTSVRMHFLRLYFLQNGFMTAKDFDNDISQRHYVKHKSYRWTLEIIKMLTEEFNIPKKEIKENFSVLLADPDNLRKLLTIPPIGGVHITEILQQIPSLRRKSYESVQNTLVELKKFGMSDETIKNCFRVLTMDAKIVRSRLLEMKSKNDLQTMDFHPGFLKLISHKFKAQSRLNHLNVSDKKCFNVSALTGGMDYFQRFADIENDKNLGKDCILFLTKTLEVEEDVIKNEISRHPYWQNIPFSDMKQTINMLKNAGFGLKDICTNIHIVLYSGDLILKKLGETKEIGGYCLTNLPKALQLKMILYQIEAEFNFSGDGVWLDRK